MNGMTRNHMHPPARRLGALSLALLLCACATSPQGRTKITSPAPISDVYSDAEMRLDLATIPNNEMPCSDGECDLNRDFNRQVQQLGANIAAAAYAMHPDLIQRINQFEFDVIEKKEAGITSNASGKIVVLRGTQQIGLNETALAFVLAREMGHVISQHHDENTTTRIVLSVAVGLLFPALNLFGNSAALAQATSASTATTTMLATTAASSATSYFGSKLVLNSLKPEQLSEADQVALKLMERMGWSHKALADALAASAEFEPGNAWAEEFRYSIAQVMALETTTEDSSPLPPITNESAEAELGPLMDLNLQAPEEIPVLQVVQPEAAPATSSPPKTSPSAASPASTSRAKNILQLSPSIQAKPINQTQKSSKHPVGNAVKTKVRVNKEIKSAKTKANEKKSKTLSHVKKPAAPKPQATAKPLKPNKKTPR